MSCIANVHDHCVPLRKIARNMFWFERVVCHTTLLTVPEQLDVKPLLTRFSKRPGPTMTGFAGIPLSWLQAQALSSAEGATVTALTARRFLDAKAKLQTGGKLTGSGKIMI